MVHFNFTKINNVFSLVILIFISSKKNILVNSQENEIEDTVQPLKNKRQLMHVHEIEGLLYNVTL